MPSKCIIYLRCSTQKQSLGDSLRRQLDVCLNKARKDNRPIIAIFSDAKSGSGFLPQREHAIKLAESENCPIYVEDLSRWTRNRDNIGNVDVIQCSEIAVDLEKTISQIFDKYLQISQ